MEETVNACLEDQKMNQLSPIPPHTGYKSKWVAGLLSFLIPGTGYLYLGLMAKGIAIMLLLALDIAAIAFAAIELNHPLLIILLSLLLPIIYFYNLFDAIQSTDMVNAQRQAWRERVQQQAHAHVGDPHHSVPPGPYPPARQAAPAQISTAGLIVLALAAVLILIASGTGSSSWLIRTDGARAGAILLIGAGIGIWFWESRRKSGGNG
jgi:hypothetical protein